MNEVCWLRALGAVSFEEAPLINHLKGEGLAPVYLEQVRQWAGTSILILHMYGHWTVLISEFLLYPFQ